MSLKVDSVQVSDDFSLLNEAYIPEGMEWKDERHLDYINTDNKGGFSIDSVLIGDGNLEEGLTDTSV